MHIAILASLKRLLNLLLLAPGILSKDNTKEFMVGYTIAICISANSWFLRYILWEIV